MSNHNHNTGFGPVFSAVTAMMSPAHQTITRHTLYERVEPLEIHPGFKAITQYALKQIRLWHQRATGRDALVKLDDHMLQDIGVKRADALTEWAKPFWRR